jgi:hypothetical protein
MSRHPDPGFDPRIADWLEADPDHAPPDLLRTVAGAIPSIPQRRALRLPWRSLPMHRLVILGASVALLAALGLGAWTVGSRPVVPAVTTAPSVPAAVEASPDPSPTDAMAGYVAARNAVCEAANRVGGPIKERIDPALYAPDASEAERTDALDALREFADLADGYVAQLEALEAPPALVAEHAANAARYRDVLILIRTSLALHDEGRRTEAIAVDFATDGISELISVYETRHRLTPCP